MMSLLLALFVGVYFGGVVAFLILTTSGVPYKGQILVLHIIDTETGELVKGGILLALALTWWMVFLKFDGQKGD